MIAKAGETVTLGGAELTERLAAILAADAAGYSRLMASNERATVTALDAARAVFRSQIESNQGRVVDVAGDSVLAIFRTASGAAVSALAIQNDLQALVADVPEEQRLYFRIGLHMGDVMEKSDGTVYGDGVNIAARLQALAEPGQIVVSESVRNAVKGKIGAAFEDRGEHVVKNIVDPIRVWQLALGVAPHSKESTRPPAGLGLDLSLPDRPSIAVLPFANLSGDLEQEYFCDGVTEDIITELSRFQTLFVIARASSFSYKGKSPDVRKVGMELGVRYVLDGSIRRTAHRIRVTAQLVDATTGNHIWAERYERVLEDIFAVQEEVTERIVGEIAPQVDAAELLRTRRRPGNLSAYELAIRAAARVWEGFQRSDLAARNEALALGRAALAIDAQSVAALAVVAFAQWQHVAFRTADDPLAAFHDGMNAAEQGIALAQSNYCYSAKAALLAYCPSGSRWSEAREAAETAWRLNPQESRILSNSGFIIACSGNPEEGIRLMERALRLNPRDPFAFNHYENLAQAHLAARRYREGLQWAQRSVSAAPRFTPAHIITVALLVGLGDIEKARETLEFVRQIAPEAGRVRAKSSERSANLEADDGAVSRQRYQTFLRVAAGLEDPSAADMLR